MKSKKSRFFFLHPDTNPIKRSKVEDLYAEFLSYRTLCVKTLLGNRKLSLSRKEMKAFFPGSDVLTSQIQKNAQDEAVVTVRSWAAATYSRKIKKQITLLKKEGAITEDEARQLYAVGKYSVSKPSATISQEAIDFYWDLLDTFGGKKPEVRYGSPMYLTEMTSKLTDPEETIIADYWLKISTLEPRKTVWLPLVGNPYVAHADEVSKTIQCQPTTNGRWRFMVVEKKEYEIPEVDLDAPRLGLDVGLNVLAATSSGDLYGEDVKPKFDKKWEQIKKLRANRQRQGLKEDSLRLKTLESKLSGLVKTETGRIVNLLVAKHPGTVFVLEDLDLSGCAGQKRFAYRALQHSLETKAPCIKINPAYTSQECPSCGYISRKNRTGTKFHCRFCGRVAHADWVGSTGILRRSQDVEISLAMDPESVKEVLIGRFLLAQRGIHLSGFLRNEKEPPPLGPGLTTEGSGLSLDVGTALESRPI